MWPPHSSSAHRSIFQPLGEQCLAVLHTAQETCLRRPQEQRQTPFLRGLDLQVAPMMPSWFIIKVTMGNSGRSLLAAQNAIGDRNSVKLGGLTDTLLGYNFLKNQPDSMRNNKDTLSKACATEKWAHS